MGAKVGKKQKPSIPVMPVEWIDNAAQNAGTVVEIVREAGKADKKRRYRLHVLERMARLPAGKGRLEYRQKEAGLRLYEAWCECNLSPTAIREIFVDGTLDADAITVAQVEAMQRFAALYRYVPSDLRGAVDHVVLRDQKLPKVLTADGRRDRSMSAQLRVALDLLANHLGY